MSNTLTKPERETLKAVWRLCRAPGADGFARTGDLAGSLRVSPATATATVKRLAERGLLSHTPYHGVVLSAEGERRAMQVIRRHRIVERFATLPQIMQASLADLEEVGGVGEAKARAVKDGLARMVEASILERYE